MAIKRKRDTQNRRASGGDEAAPAGDAPPRADPDDESDSSEEPSSPKRLRRSHPPAELDKLRNSHAYSEAMAVLNKLLADPAAKIFAKPVLELWSEDELPDYFEIVEQPMDLGTIMKRTKALDYIVEMDGRLEFDDVTFFGDVRRVFKNAMRYNGAKSEYHRHARRLLAQADRKFTIRPMFSKPVRKPPEAGEGEKPRDTPRRVTDVPASAATPAAAPASVERPLASRPRRVITAPKSKYDDSPPPAVAQAAQRNAMRRNSAPRNPPPRNAASRNAVQRTSAEDDPVQQSPSPREVESRNLSPRNPAQRNPAPRNPVQRNAESRPAAPRPPRVEKPVAEPETSSAARRTPSRPTPTRPPAGASRPATGGSRPNSGPRRPSSGHKGPAAVAGSSVSSDDMETKGEVEFEFVSTVGMEKRRGRKSGIVQDLEARHEMLVRRRRMLKQSVLDLENMKKVPLTHEEKAALCGRVAALDLVSMNAVVHIVAQGMNRQDMWDFEEVDMDINTIDNAVLREIMAYLDRSAVVAAHGTLKSVEEEIADIEVKLLNIRYQRI